MAHDLLANFHCLAKTRVAATLGAPRKLRVLEIGSALGFFLSILRDEGWEVEGREMWVDWRRFSNRYLNVPTSGELMQGQGKPKYDLIFCSQVLEHVSNFAEFLAAAYSRLLRGGMLAVSTTNSNIGTLPRASLDGKMVNLTTLDIFDNNYHISHWSRRSIGAAARNVGFKNIYTKTRGEHDWELVMYAIKAE
jgi:2-polyprenyl-3-methyl-5-hydroxy-6-metoxy-1,4-benzoquinol methylase